MLGATTGRHFARRRRRRKFAGSGTPRGPSEHQNSNYSHQGFAARHLWQDFLLAQLWFLHAVHSQSPFLNLTEGQCWLLQVTRPP